MGRLRYSTCAERQVTPGNGLLAVLITLVDDLRPTQDAIHSQYLVYTINDGPAVQSEVEASDSQSTDHVGFDTYTIQFWI